MTRPDCERLGELALRGAEGLPLDPESRAFRDAHLAGCADCRRQEQALSALRMSEDDEAHFPFDLLSRQRTVNRALAALQDPGEAKDEAPQGWLQALRWRLAGALAVAGAAAAVALFVGRTAPAPLAAAPAARVLLASGTAPLAAGLALKEGQLLGGEDGELALALGQDVVVLLEPGARGQLGKLQADGVELHLESGAVHASVTPHSRGPRFSVRTAAGKAEVTGTVFSVRTGDSASEVQVLRGSVRVTPNDGEARPVEALQVRPFGGTASRPFTQEEQQRALAMFRRLSLFEPAAAATLQVRSAPPGAEVLLDGEPLGRTPLAAEVKTGHRHLQVRAEGRAEREEWLDLFAGQVTLRDLDLLATAVPAEARPATAGSDRAAPRTSATVLLRRAQERRLARDWTGAAEAYRALIAEHPGLPAAEAALVSLGQLALGQLEDPAAGLRSCQQYLARQAKGPLASEAMVCRIHALEALGREAEATAASRAFLERYPTSPHAAELRERLAR